MMMNLIEYSGGVYHVFRTQPRLWATFAVPTAQARRDGDLICASRTVMIAEELISYVL